MATLDSTQLAKAILYALVVMDALPLDRQEAGERDDLVHMLHLIIQDPAHREALAVEVERKTGVLVDITDWQARNWRV
jgi:hypothetical protein